MPKEQSLPDVQLTDERRDVQSMLELDPETMDKSLNYRFVKDDPMNIARKRLKGYRPVLKEADGVKTLVDVEDQADGLIRVGDTILMACPKEGFRKRQREARKFSEGRLRIPKKRVKEKARENNIKLIEEEED